MTTAPASYHVPVLADACVDLLAGAPAGAIVDGTAGGGGHLALMRDRFGGDRPLIGVDKDPDALAATGARLGAAVTLLRGDFRDLRALLAAHLGGGARVAGILLDLGVSSWQLDTAARGFAIKHPEAPLDMRMDPDSGAPTARELIATLDEGELTRILRDLGEVPRARLMARRLREAVAAGGVATTGDLARLVAGAQTRNPTKRVHPATQVFQALRIAVNDELGALEQILADAPDLLAPGGRLVVIAYHSLEDRRVKRAFRRGERGPDRPGHLPPPSAWRPTWRTLTRKPIVADQAEVARNPRARSAKVRAAERAPLALSDRSVA
ncbi:MAG: 16S rRNA (cytosine(1402)-N(4))-methyltransferase [Proteobacteria bacterium]|nr:MAG: 16S rRNA (cytosine(1402)-N(4))-methyltransferase [Pseudomonadota bacterium]